MENKFLLICLNFKPCQGFLDNVLTVTSKNCRCPSIQCSLQWGATTEQDFHGIYERRLHSDAASFTSWSTPLSFDQPLKVTGKTQTQLVNTEQWGQNENFPFACRSVSPKQQQRDCRLLSAPEISWNTHCHSLLLYKIAAAGFKPLQSFYTQIRAWGFWLCFKDH